MREEFEEETQSLLDLVKNDDGLGIQFAFKERLDSDLNNAIDSLELTLKDKQEYS